MVLYGYITIDYNSVIIEPTDPVKEGYTFAGWNPDVPVTMPASNVALTAQWIVNQYTIMFNSAGGSAVSALTQNYATAITAPAAPTMEGYTFMGWTPVLPSAMPANNMTLTATWSLNYYIVSFITYTTPIPSVGVNHGEKVSAPVTPIREGYYFAGWYSDSYNTTL
ncbi:MAG TPA: InlB B-repeat-containing protein, partial [Clostridia bacterium]|nr:InlB B-repeat-containing protein [Clostridia bacterium]